MNKPFQLQKYQYRSILFITNDGKRINISIKKEIEKNEENKKKRNERDDLIKQVEITKKEITE